MVSERLLELRFDMYGSWFTVLFFTLGVMLGVLALVRLVKIYYTLYRVNRDHNPGRAEMYKTMLQNNIMEILLFVAVVVFVIVALLYQPEVSFGMY